MARFAGRDAPLRSGTLTIVDGVGKVLAGHAVPDEVLAAMPFAPIFAFHPPLDATDSDGALPLAARAKLLQGI